MRMGGNIWFELIEVASYRSFFLKVYRRRKDCKRKLSTIDFLLLRIGKLEVKLLATLKVSISNIAKKD